MKRKAGRSKLPKPIGPPPMRSRKKARQVTTLFHKLTKLRDEALQLNDTRSVEKLEQQINDMGGFDEYQRASQLNTQLHSTSRWVLKVLMDRGLLHVGGDSNGGGHDDGKDGQNSNSLASKNQGNVDELQKNHKDTNRRIINQRKILEIGAINTDLLKASQKYSFLRVHAIDLHSSHPDIEELDFLSMPIDELGYDVIVCSMVLNYVSSPTDRGNMLRLIYQQLRPMGLCFLTLPKLCLNQSQYATKECFDAMLINELGFVVEGKKETPKIYFWVLQRPAHLMTNKMMSSSTATSLQRKRKKFCNSFQVIL